jgi:glucokinase
MILAGDVGGTKVHLALYNFEGGRLRSLREHKYPAHEYADLAAVIEKFLEVGDVDRKDIVAEAHEPALDP